MLGLGSLCGNRVDVEVEERRGRPEPGQTGLLGHLAARRVGQVSILGFHVSPRLEPSMQFRMIDQEHGPRVGTEDPGAGREVTRVVPLAVERIARRGEQGEHPRPVGFLDRVGRTVGPERV